MTSNGPYLQPLDPEDVPKLEATFKSNEGTLGFAANDLLTMARRPGPAEAYMKFATTVMSEVTLPADLAHLITLVASVTARCQYSTAHSASNCKQAGISNEKIAATFDFEASPLFNEREKVALGFASKAAQSPSALEQDDYDHMQSRFTETEIINILLIVCKTGFFNRWNDSVATTLEPKPLSAAKTCLSNSRWQVGKHG